MMWRFEGLAFYHDRFVTLADQLVDATKLLAHLVGGTVSGDTATTMGHRIVETSGQQLHDIVDHVDRRLITPYASDELHTLATEFDRTIRETIEITHLLTNTARAKPSVVETDLRSLVVGMQSLASNAQECITALENPSRVPNAANSLAAQSEQGGEATEAALAHLFANPLDPTDVLWWKDVYERCARVLKHGTQIAHTVRALALKTHDH
jgi:uncharacterized protein Yka (UPF0111/DUF47 family)